MRTKWNFALGRRLRAALILALAAGTVIVLGSGRAQAQMLNPGDLVSGFLGDGFGLTAGPSCSSVITSCGCVITRSGTYIVANDLSASQTSRKNCIEIAAGNSILNLKGNAIIGNGRSGIGILIRNNASHVVVEGGDEGDATPPDDAGINGDDFPAAQGVVTQWNIGIEDDGDNAVIELFKQVGGNIFQQHFGNRMAGVFINGARNSMAGDLHASYNGQDGIMVANSSGIRLSNFSAIGNNEAGVRLQQTNDSTISTASAANNAKYGMWLQYSSRNAIINCNGTSGNGDTGILLDTPSNQNLITNSGAPGNVKAGIVIAGGSRDNTVTVTHSNGNPDKHDMVDLNPNCDSNIWYNNTGSGNQSCIH